MKHIEYIQNCTEDELANLLSIIVINLMESMTGEYASQTIIEFEKAQVKKWLEMEMVKGDYLN